MIELVLEIHFFLVVTFIQIILRGKIQITNSFFTEV